MPEAASFFVPADAGVAVVGRFIPVAGLVGAALAEVGGLSPLALAGYLSFSLPPAGSKKSI